MSEIARILEAKKQELQALKEHRSTAHCAWGNSTGTDVRREMEVEELEDEIKELEKRVSVKS